MKHWSVIPNFVDTARFAPMDAAEQQSARTRLGLPIDAFVIGDAAAIKTEHKRCDALIRAFAAWAETEPRARLALAGARTAQTDAIVTLANELVPDRVFFLLDLPRDRMPDFYGTLDVFVHAALFEMMPIALLEALACACPVLHHDQPVMNWMVGDGGLSLDMADQAALIETLSALARDPARMRVMSDAARCQAVERFSRETVIPRIAAMYRSVIGESC